jgi:hypothetical protein
VLITKGVTAWQRLLTHLTPATAPSPASSTSRTLLAAHQTASTAAPDPTPTAVLDRLPQEVAAQLVHALAGLAVALTGT